MNSDDDPEARIRALEQPLSDAARASEFSSGPPPGTWAQPSGPPPPMPSMPYGGTLPYPPTGRPGRGRAVWVLLALFVIGVIALPVGIFLYSSHHGARGGLTAPLPVSPSATVAPTTPAPKNVTVSGINEVRTVTCDGGTVSVSGITNNVTITGHCARLDVSGVQNHVTVDSADNIDASGSGNRVAYRSGSPTIDKSGFDNVVERGSGH